MIKRTLEIGPGPAPMHHRSADDLALNDDEVYIGVDINNVFDTPLWQRAFEKYGGRVFNFTGDREELSDIEDGSIDELVALGTHDIANEKVRKQFNRVLKNGGRIFLGSPVARAQSIKDVMQKNLPGYVEMPAEQITYSLHRQGAEMPYSVVVFMKQ